MQDGGLCSVMTTSCLIFLTVLVFCLFLFKENFLLFNFLLI